MSKLHKTILLVTALVVLVVSLSTLRKAFVSSNPHGFLQDHGEANKLNLSVGFNLAPSSGYVNWDQAAPPIINPDIARTIAVDYGNGTVWVDREDGDEAYREVMARLSLASSQHLA